MSKFVQVCPNCGAAFAAWRTWRITRWSNMRCPACNAALNRNIDWQFAAVLIGGGSALNFVLSLPLPRPIQIVLDVATVAAILAVDAMTMRLVVAEERQAGKSG